MNPQDGKVSIKAGEKNPACRPKKVKKEAGESDPHPAQKRLAEQGSKEINPRGLITSSTRSGETSGGKNSKRRGDGTNKKNYDIEIRVLDE